MTLKVTHTSTRPSTNIAFYGEEFWSLAEIVSYIKQTYEDTGKLLGTAFIVSSDALTHTWIEYWDSQESVDQFESDSFLNQDMNSRTAYRSQNGIELSIVIESVETAPLGVYYRPY